jgi:hypothetical protein
MKNINVLPLPAPNTELSEAYAPPRTYAQPHENKRFYRE